ncbi:hypothetical protein [Chelatococcus asaccharovorans]|nr:hypothetical protein [Chelatococcus asaccharovorans]MBS7707137.1 hypothetical protein [Chelatococcus asaccharovorans]
MTDNGLSAAKDDDGRQAASPGSEPAYKPGLDAGAAMAERCFRVGRRRLHVPFACPLSVGFSGPLGADYAQRIGILQAGRPAGAAGVGRRRAQPRAGDAYFKIIFLQEMNIDFILFA